MATARQLHDGTIAREAATTARQIHTGVIVRDPSAGGSPPSTMPPLYHQRQQQGMAS